MLAMSGEAGCMCMCVCVCVRGECKTIHGRDRLFNAGGLLSYRSFKSICRVELRLLILLERQSVMSEHTCDLCVRRKKKGDRMLYE